MPELLDTVNKQLSTSVEFERGMAAYFASSADTKQRALDACLAVAARDDELQKAYDDKCAECEKWKEEALRLREELKQALQSKLNLNISGKAKVKKLITGDVHEHYAKDNNNQGQYHKRIGTGGKTLSLV